jgi:hypothetical protein
MRLTKAPDGVESSTSDKRKATCEPCGAEGATLKAMVTKTPESPDSVVRVSVAMIARNCPAVTFR